ncbi:hypothetical protein [Sphaerisporangium dianthi]|uniref:Uncharacterized protein n=1 Tax=Sphaerisporangium dianthi TaxID=1436120 RepID=A0ABV9CRP8_9ACTN
MHTIYHLAHIALATGQNLAVPSWQNYVVPVTSGVLVAVLLGGVRIAWSRRRVPSALSRGVRRKTYLGAVLSESERGCPARLDVLAPRLSPATESTIFVKIQDAWKRINGRKGVRVVILDSQESLIGGIELMAEGIDVRVTRRELGTESLSFHLFEREGRSAPSAIVNHREDLVDRPVRLNGMPATRLLWDHFEKIWADAQPLEAVLAEKICEKVSEQGEPRAVWRALHEVEVSLNVDLDGAPKVLPHLAFRNSARVVFVVGLPGSGKSHVRRVLARHLAGLGIKTSELSDYTYAYRDFLHAMAKLEPVRAPGFTAYAGGGFSVNNIEVLRPALQALAQAVRDSVKEPRVTIVEFARPDLVAALREFEDLRLESQVIHVNAPAPLRTQRLNRRIEPPEVSVDDTSVTFTLSDNHVLPPAAKQSIYKMDNFPELMADPHWRGRVFSIDNDVDDGGATIETRLGAFVERVIQPYRQP